VATTRTKKHLPRIVTLTAARRHFGQILERAFKGKERFVVHTHGDPLAVIMGVEEYLKYFGQPTVKFKRVKKGWRA
jgi:prevent-host-death family protein